MTIKTTFTAILIFVMTVALATLPLLESAEAKEIQPWWPLVEIDPPEIYGFTIALEEEVRRDKELPMFLPCVPSFYNDEVGLPKEVHIAVIVARRIFEKPAVRQLIYHEVWRAKIGDIFTDLSFLNRTREENETLIKSAQFFQIVHATVPLVFSTVRQEALRACYQFYNSLVDKWINASVLDIQLRGFLDNFEKAFRLYEHMLVLPKSDPFTPLLSFTYVPSKHLITVDGAFRFTTINPGGEFVLEGYRSAFEGKLNFPFGKAKDRIIATIAQNTFQIIADLERKTRWPSLLR